MIGQSYSTSLRCGMVQFVGGPFDGQSGLYDSNTFDAIGFCDPAQRVTHDYKPEHKGRSWRYIYSGPHHWGPDTSNSEHGS